MTDEPLVELDLTVNGEHYAYPVAADMPLVHFLHLHGLTGTKIGCSIGECRACTVAVRVGPDGPTMTRQACMTSMRHVRGWHVTTIEGLADGDALHPVQQAFLDGSAFQCGYCAAGFAIAGSVAVEHVKPGDDDETIAERTDALLGSHQCRCTDYSRYRGAILSVAREAAKRPREWRPSRGRAPARENRGPRTAPETWRAERSGEHEALFDDPALELIRLLRHGAELEHGLMIQYLYAAFSVKQPEYARLAGWPSHRYGGRPLHLMGVAIEEMTHLDIVNECLVALGAAPHLGRPPFPHGSEHYPFEFKLEPLSRRSLAKYVYVEASPSAVDRKLEHAPEYRAFLAELYAVLREETCEEPPSNQVGSLYRNLSEVLARLRSREPDRLDYAAWEQRMEVLKEEGESEHFDLFRSLFDGSHPALGDRDVWTRPLAEQPARRLRVASALSPLDSGADAHDRALHALRHLANLHYWTVCMLLDRSYRMGGQLHSAARRHMTGPLRSIGAQLAEADHGMPFDVLASGYAPGLGEPENLALTRRMAQEVIRAQERYERYLAPDYSHACAHETLWELTAFGAR